MSLSASIISQYFVKENLKVFATAKFPFADYKYSVDQANTFTVMSLVDAENSYGANIRNEYWVKIRYVGGDKHDCNNWQLVDININ